MRSMTMKKIGASLALMLTVALLVPAGPGRVEAENLMLRGGYYGEDYHGASGARVTAINEQDGSVQCQLGAPAGTYSITIGYVDEPDGASSFELRVNGAAIDAEGI